MSLFSRKWWASRAHPNEYPFIPKSLWTFTPTKYPPHPHPSQTQRISWYFTNDTLRKELKGRFARFWRAKALMEGLGTLSLPWVEKILDEKGDRNVAGYFNGLIICYVEGFRYAVPIVWGWPDYGIYDRQKGFFDRQGDVKLSNLEKCKRWGITEDYKKGNWSVSPSLLKEGGADKIHFMLRIHNVPENPPWTQTDEERLSPQEEWFRKHAEELKSKKPYGDISYEYWGWD